MPDDIQDNTNRPIFARLRHYDGLQNELFEVLSAAETGVIRYSDDEEIFRIDSHPESPLIIESGWAYHYKLMPDGARQICQLLLPGDIIDGVAMLPGGKTMTGVAAAKAVTVRRMDSVKLIEALRDHPKIAAAFWWTVVQTDNMFREHISRIGRKSSAEALAHLLTELTVRCEMAGVSEDGGIRLPLTQTDLGDFLGITPVHVSRMLTLLKRGNFLTLNNGLLHLSARDALIEFGAFSSDYLTAGFEMRAPVRAA